MNKKDYDKMKIRLPSWQCSLKTQIDFETLVDELGISKSAAIEEAMLNYIALKSVDVAESVEVSSLVG